MRLTLSLILIAAVALYGASFLQVARSAPLPATGSEAGQRPARGDARRDQADWWRAKPIGPPARSICTGCGGPVVPFEPSGGAQARRALDAARTPRPAVGPPPAGETAPGRRRRRAP